MLIYGLDPGVTGAIAAIVNGRLHDVRDLPVRQEGGGTVKRRIDSAGLAAIVREWRAQLGPDSELAVLERVGAMPAQGVASVFSLGHTAGACEGVLLALGCPVEFVAPAVWKRAAGLGRDKADSRAKASLVFPGHAGLWTRVKDHNRAEAVMLAHYGWGRRA
jgi:crossover junction endodeoxyribonuclease RuvC